MGRKAFCCCSLRVGVIFIGALSIVFSVLGLAVVCAVAYRLTAVLLVKPPAALHPVAPTPDPDAEFVRVPRHSAAHLRAAPRRALHRTIEHYTRLLLQNMDSASLTEAGTTKTTNQDGTDINDRESEMMEKNDSINGSGESSSDGRRQVEESTQEVEIDTRSSQKDRFAEPSIEANLGGKQTGGDSANSFDSPQRPPKPTSPQSSTEMASHPDSLDMSAENTFVGRRSDGESTGRELLEEEEGNFDDKNGKENKGSPICGGLELEKMMFEISFLSAYEAVEQSREVAARALGSAALGAGLYAVGLAALKLAGVVEVLHFGAGVLLIVGAAKGRGELLRPWRLLALATWALVAGGHAVSLAAFYPLHSRDPSKAKADAGAVVLVVIYIAVYAYCYSVVLKLENELYKKKQKKENEGNEPEEKERSNIYSCRF